MKSLTQGGEANRTGKVLENEVERFLDVEFNIFPVNYKTYFEEAIVEPENARGILLKNVPYTNIYGGKGRGEFLLSVNGKTEARIECRFQQSPGSVDEKFPYLFETAVAFEERIVILIVEGDGYKNGAKEWLKSKCEAVKYKEIYMFTLEEFKSWAKDYLKPARFFKAYK